MTLSVNLNQFSLNQYFVDDAIITQTNPVGVLCSSQFLDARLKRLVHQRLDYRNHPINDADGQLPQVLLRGLFPLNAKGHCVSGSA